MSKQHLIEAKFRNNDSSINVNVIIVSFMDGNIHIFYSPHLEVYGYGETEYDAIESFNHHLGEFLSYSTNKNTLHDELIRLGWQLKKGSKKNPKRITAPEFSDLIESNDSFKDIVNNHNFNTTHKQVAIPV